jgi:hypothetical protein
MTCSGGRTIIAWAGDRHSKKFRKALTAAVRSVSETEKGGDAEGFFLGIKGFISLLNVFAILKKKFL